MANTGRKEASGAEAEGAEGRSAVATMIRLIHDLYASTGSRASIRGGRDSELIIWSELIGAVQSRESHGTESFSSTTKASSASRRRSPTPSGS
jgi:hypothetical protein